MEAVTDLDCRLLVYNAAYSRVASIALKNLGKKVLIIPGFSNRMAYFLLTRILPHRMAAALVNRTMGRTYKGRGE